jgi:hypothetical protein
MCLLISNPGYDTIVEYYRKDGPTFLCKSEIHNYFLKPHTHTDIRLTDIATVPLEVQKLPDGTSFIQRITITFNTAMTSKKDPSGRSADCSRRLY